MSAWLDRGVMIEAHTVSETVLRPGNKKLTIGGVRSNLSGGLPVEGRVAPARDFAISINLKQE